MPEHTFPKTIKITLFNQIRPMSPSEISIYTQRRNALASQLGPQGVAIIPTAPEQQRNRDSDFLFRHDSYFYYLSGFTEPHAWLVIDGKGHTTLFCQPKDLEREIWDGMRVGPEAAPQTLGVDAAFSVKELDAKLPALLDGCEAVWFPFATHKGLETRVDGWLGTLRARVRYGALCPQQQRDLCGRAGRNAPVQGRARTGHVMRRAAQHQCRVPMCAPCSAARACCAGPVRCANTTWTPSCCTSFGAMARSTPPMDPSWPLAPMPVCLHYRADAALVRSGELVLIDAGCELDGYAADITRTFPANGSFSPERSALYELVLASQEAAIAATKPGARFTDPHDATVKVLAQGMLDVGLLDKNKVGSLDDVIEKRAYFQFYMHRTGHWIGMDVHDCGAYTEPSQIGEVSERKDALTGETIRDRPARLLQPGMVLTIEPGIYVRPADGVPEMFHNIGIRIEDDAIVTEAACELITRDVPVRVDEIEALMRD
jgi:Xaa-Pro aminopeptidase